MISDGLKFLLSTFCSFYCAEPLTVKIKSHGAEKGCGIENALLKQPISAIICGITQKNADWLLL